jgi:peroxiredoxin
MEAVAYAEEAKAELGKAAPDFSRPDLQGHTIKLGDFRGKKVVLEWFNPDCPFVRYAHTKGPLKDLAKQHAKQGVVWLAINSGAPGKQGTGLAHNQEAAKTYGMDYPILLDEDGQVGRMYGAKSTPHMFIIDERGVLVYRGGLDNAPLGEVHDGPALVSYVDQALADLLAKRLPKTSDTRSYGCSVKYGP